MGPELLSRQGAAQAALRQRVLDSQEPFARFGLTNTFAGLLGVVLILTLGCWQRWNWCDQVPTAVVAAVVGLTLILTRSRTAWLSTVCGLLFLGSARWRAGDSAGWSQRLMSRLIPMGGVAVLAGVIAVALGAVDQQDLVEAPKSVEYRVQYWIATWAVVREHPWLGVGPGNFRQHYLQHKLPGASEEIADPHNLVLDIWSTGGIVALAGLLAVVWLAARVWRDVLTGPVTQAESDTASVSGGAWRRTAGIGVAACGSVFAAAFLQARVDTQVVWMASGWIPAAWLVHRLIERIEPVPGLVRCASAAAVLMLTIHLLAVGGIAMPVILMLLLTLLVILDDGGVPASTDGAAIVNRVAVTSPRAARAVVACFVVLCAAGLWTAFLPVLRASLYSAAGEGALYIDHRPDRAAEFFRQAVDADPLSPAAWRDLAIAETTLWQQGGRRAERHFEAAIAAVQEAIERNPLSPHLWRTLGDLWLRRWRQTGAPAEAERAINALQRAADLYPNSSTIQADLALTLSQAGRRKQAAEIAAIALQLDDINYIREHYDKTFTDEQYGELADLAEDFGRYDRDASPRN